LAHTTAPFIATKRWPCFSCDRPPLTIQRVCAFSYPPSLHLSLQFTTAPEVKRSRDPAILETCDIVVDVGGVYDARKQRFDHHQRGFSEVFGHGFETKLSSAGLVYKSIRSFVVVEPISLPSYRHFGREIIGNKLHLPQDHQTVEECWLKLYRVRLSEKDG
jgi:hypothetical protein